MTPRKRTLSIAAVALTGLVLSACGGSDAADPSTAEETQDLEVFSWWTSGSEDAALKELISAYSDKHSGVEVTNGAVAGGGGGNAQQILQTRIQGGNPPDTFQTHPQESLTPYLDANALADISAAYEDGVKEAVPEELIEAQSKDGKLYGMSVGAHRGNVLWYSLPALEKAGVTPPEGDYTPEQFLADLKKVDESGGTGLCLGAKDTFASAQLFENTLLGTAEAEGYNALVGGEKQWDDDLVASAADTFTEIMSYADGDASALTWDQAIKRLGDGECAFNSMGDWAYGDLVKAGKTADEDFGYVAHPGTDGTFVLVVDTFAVSAQAKNLKNAMDFVTILGDKDVQVAFNKLKGSTPIRTDVDVSSLSEYQQEAAGSYKDDAKVWSIAHGQATNPQFQQALNDAVIQLISNKDTSAFVSDLKTAAGS